MDIRPLNTVHTSLWKEGEGGDTPAASHLMAYLILYWGCMRLASASGAPIEWAVVSFLVEGVVFACEGLIFGKVHAAQGMAVAFVSFGLALCYAC